MPDSDFTVGDKLKVVAEVEIEDWAILYGIYTRIDDTSPWGDIKYWLWDEGAASLSALTKPLGLWGKKITIETPYVTKVSGAGRVYARLICSGLVGKIKVSKFGVYKI